jgi:hypothetical protein
VGTDKRQIEGVHGCDRMVGIGTWYDILSASIAPITIEVGTMLTATQVLLQGFFVLIVASLLTMPVLLTHSASSSQLRWSLVTEVGPTVTCPSTHWRPMRWALNSAPTTSAVPAHKRS